MKKPFCDMCGKPAGEIRERFRSVVGGVAPECDKTALIEMSVQTYFIQHSTGFGGTPDLCDTCFVESLEKLLKLAKSKLKV